MKVGVLGSGDVGQTLGAGLVKLGHEVMLGTRDPKSEKVQGWIQKTGGKSSSGTFAETAAFGELLVLATLFSGTASAIQLAGPDRFKNKIVIDTTNPLDFITGKPRLSVGFTDSAGEQVQKWLPNAKVVKAFNHVGSPHMVKPKFTGGPPTMFICGNDSGAKKRVEELLKVFGWETIDAGGIEESRLLEPLAMLWIQCYVLWQTGDHAFKLLKK